MAAMEAAADAMLAAASRAFCSSVAVFFQIQVRNRLPRPVHFGGFRGGRRGIAWETRKARIFFFFFQTFLLLVLIEE